MFLPTGLLEAFGLVLVRTGALVVTAPILGAGTGFSGYKVALVFFLSVILYGAAGLPMLEALDPIGYGILALREIMIGLFLGFILHVALLSVRVAGELIGQEMGFMMARQVDPVTGIQTPLITSLYENMFVMGLISINGHHWLLGALADSFDRAPVGSFDFGGNLAEPVQRMFGEMMQAGIVFAAPVLIFLMMVTIVIGLLARVVPQMNVLEIGFTLRVIVALVGLFAFAPLLEPALGALYRSFSGWLDRGLMAIGG